MTAKRTCKESVSTFRDKINTRRKFLQDAGVMAGGIGLLGVPSRLPWLAQIPSCPPPLAITPTDCTPPTSTKPAIQFQPDLGLAVRTRKSAWQLTPQEIQKLKNAYCEMRKLSLRDPDDPRGWLHQANVHCHYCSGALANQEPEIHNGWLFFPWHRCYLYFHERILGSLIGDPTLTLAYWDWDTPGHDILPPPFVTPNDGTNPLWDPTRGESPTDTITPPYATQPYLYGPDGVLNSHTNLIFMGSPNPDPETTQVRFGGAMEFGPHGVIHLWTTDPKWQTDQSTGVPNMGVLATAAQDPVFFAHHSNIDRLWNVWLGNGTRQYPHQNFNDPVWLSQRFTFYDEKATLRSMSVNDVLQMSQNLRYVYSDPRTGQPAPEPVSEPQTGPLAPTRQKITAEVHASAEPERTELTPSGVTRKIVIPSNLRGRILNSAKPTSEALVYVLHIDGIEVPANESAVVHVFANMPNASSTTATNTINFLGYFTIVAKSTESMDHHGHRPANVVLDITTRLPELIKAGRDLTITLVPGTGGKDRPSKIHISFRNIYLTEETL